MSRRLDSDRVSAEGDLGVRRDPPDPTETGLMGTGGNGTSRGDARRALALLRESGLSGPMVAVATTLVIALGMLVAHWLRPDLGWPHWVCLGFLVLGILSGIVAWTRLRDRLLLPLVRLERSVARISQGEPGASEALRSAGVLDRIARDIGDLNAELTELSEDMDARVGRQTMRLAQKTASLKILYDVAAGIHQADGVDALLLRFLRVLKEMVNGRAATVRLVLADGTRRLVGSIGLDDDLVREQDMAPVDLCLCGSVLSPGDILCDQQARYCSRIYGRRMFDAEQLEVITVPLEHRDELLGVYTIFVDRPGVSAREDILDLLATVGHHLGVAIAKQRSDAEARRLSIIEERNSLAHELHDSLAQTLASLRFQVRMLHDALAQVAIPDNARLDLGRVMNGLDEAHNELRELLASFRAPWTRAGWWPPRRSSPPTSPEPRGSMSCSRTTAGPCGCRPARSSRWCASSRSRWRISASMPRAQTVRVLFTREPGGRYLVLIEDDGVGFRIPETEERAGEHIGLSIMDERARRIGAELRIESEPGEGTRVELAIPAEPGAGGQTGGGVMRVLLIDDHALFRFGLRELLERRGIQVVAASGDSETGMRKVEETRPDVVLLDMRMPGQSGIEVLRRLRAAHPAMAIAMLTTSAEERDVIESLQSGAQGYLLKDMEPDALITALEGIVAGRTVVAPELAGVLARAVQGEAAPAAAPRRSLLRPHAPGARDPLSSRRRPEQQGDRQAAGHLGWHGQAACEGHPAQALGALTGRGGRDRGGAGPLRPLGRRPGLTGIQSTNWQVVSVNHEEVS